MTDRFGAFLVVLERDIREDDAEPILNAIRQIRGVLRVTPRKADLDEQIAESRVRQEFVERLFTVLKKEG